MLRAYRIIATNDYQQDKENQNKQKRGNALPPFCLFSYTSIHLSKLMLSVLPKKVKAWKKVQAHVATRPIVTGWLLDKDGCGECLLLAVRIDIFFINVFMLFQRA